MSANELSIPFVSSGEILAAAITLPLVGSTVVSLRFWIRSRQDSRIGADDWTILVALIFAIGMGAALIYGVADGALGYPTPPYSSNTLEAELTEISPQQRTTELVDWIIWCLMIPANGLIKLSALCLYRRLFVVHRRSVFDVVTLVFIAVITLWTVAFFLATIFGCGDNFTYPWQPLIFIASCNTNMRLDALMISDLLTDIFVWLLPMPVIWRLHMRLGRKLSITGIFLLAAVSLAAAVVRLLVQEEISNGGYAAHTDVNLTLSILLYWSMIESGLAIIAACLPTLHAFVNISVLRSALSKLRSSLKYSSTERIVDTSDKVSANGGSDFSGSCAHDSKRSRRDHYETSAMESV